MLRTQLRRRRQPLGSDGKQHTEKRTQVPLRAHLDITASCLGSNTLLAASCLQTYHVLPNTLPPSQPSIHSQCRCPGNGGHDKQMAFSPDFASPSNQSAFDGK
ncbi:hypothetical protein LZ31DRAFT_28111 [Colletotrichum somersetense]|nr:hypothetical protein LZ31DRAFT_28111 [Colletotrichum somersetense]